jgi:Zn-dependent M28 family amino/carboxypeptidase
MDVSHEIRSSLNIGGILPGRTVPDEAVAISGHWDHLGIGTPDERGDTIYNGAADNASGVAATLLCAAQAVKLSRRPDRSLLFLFYTSEESGLFGSEHYCNFPAVPMEKTLACINFESVAPEPLTHDVVVLGGGNSILDDYIVRGAQRQGRYVTFNEDNSDGWFFRSDHFNFVKKGVPAVVIESGEDLVDPLHPNKYPFDYWYHKPNDEYIPDWDVEGSLAHVHLMFGVALELASAKKR